MSTKTSITRPNGASKGEAPKHGRRTVELKLRASPDVRGALERIASDGAVTMSSAVSELVTLAARDARGATNAREWAMLRGAFLARDEGSELVAMVTDVLRLALAGDARARHALRRFENVHKRAFSEARRLRAVLEHVSGSIDELRSRSFQRPWSHRARLVLVTQDATNLRTRLSTDRRLLQDDRRHFSELEVGSIVVILEETEYGALGANGAAAKLSIAANAFGHALTRIEDEQNDEHVQVVAQLYRKASITRPDP